MDRMSAQMKQAAYLTAAVMAGLPEVGAPVEAFRIIDSVDACVRNHASLNQTAWSLPSGMDSEAFMQHLVHRGALHETGTDGYVCQIPSFRAFLAGRANMALPPPASSSDLSSGLLPCLPSGEPDRASERNEDGMEPD